MEVVVVVVVTAASAVVVVPAAAAAFVVDVVVKDEPEYVVFGQFGRLLDELETMEAMYE